MENHSRQFHSACGHGKTESWMRGDEENPSELRRFSLKGKKALYQKLRSCQLAMERQGCERRERASRKNETQRHREHEMFAIGTMAGGFAHDFNNLLMVMIGNIELAKQMAGESGKLSDYLDRALRAGMRAGRITQKLLYLTPQKNMPGKPVRMSSVVEASLRRLRSSLPAGIEIKQEFSAGVDTVMAEEVEIQEVLRNLLDNAAQSIGKTGGQITVGMTNVEISPEPPASQDYLPSGRYLKLCVADTGQGIDPSILDKIFIPYFTTRKAGMGSGLGLAVVCGILANHNGRIFVSSKIGKGTVFDIYLPVAGTDRVTRPHRKTGLSDKRQSGQ